jgi:hypothetical protein
MSFNVNISRFQEKSHSYSGGFMKNFGSVILSSALLLQILSSQAGAAQSENVVIVKRPENVVYEDSSEYNRLGKTFTATVQLWGAGPTSALTQGLAAGYFLDRNTILSLEVTNNGSNSHFQGSGYDLEATSVGLHLKRFVGNSFYLKLGIDQRQVKSKYNWNYSSEFSEASEVREFEGQSTAASFAIGNQWQWSGFTMGCDWFGLVLPISSQITREYLSSSTKDYDRSRLKESEDQQLKNTIAQGLRFYLGASF